MEEAALIPAVAEGVAADQLHQCSPNWNIGHVDEQRFAARPDHMRDL